MSVESGDSGELLNAADTRWWRLTSFWSNERIGTIIHSMNL